MNARIDMFKNNINLEAMANMGAITQTSNPWLYPIHQVYLQKTEQFGEGVFIADQKGIFTPIETGGYGAIHVQRIPLGSPVYGLVVIGEDSAYVSVTERKQLIIYVGVRFVNVKYGYMPIDENTVVKPIAGLSFPPRLWLLTAKTGGAVSVASIEEEDFSN